MLQLSCISIKYGGEFGFDGDAESGVASRCRQTTKKVAKTINANNRYALAA